MLLVVDANILFSFFRKGTLTRELIVNPDFKYNLQLVAPEKVLSELDKHKIEICKKAEIEEDEFEFPREVLEVFIGIVPDEFW